MASFNRVTLLGNLGAEVELRATTKGQAIANFSLATNEAWTDEAGKKQERVEWHRVVVWGKQAELCGKFLGKGSTCLVEGRIQSREWLDKENQPHVQYEVVATSVQFLSRRRDAGADATGAEAPGDAGEAAAF